MSHTVYATFAHPEEAERAAGALLTRGVRAEDLSVVRQPEAGGSVATTPNATATNVAAPDGPTSVPTGSVYGVPPDPTDATAERASVANGNVDSDSTDDADDPNREAVEKAKQGGLIGAGIGAVAAIAALIIPGVGFVLGAGALASAIAGVAATAGAGAAAGAIVGYLKEHGVDDEAAADYAGAVERGGAVLAVTLPSGSVDEEQANAVLAEHGASNVSRYATRGYAA